MEEYFLTLAKQKTAEADHYKAMANSFRVSSQRQIAEYSWMHCDSLAKMAREIENVAYFKLEFTQSPYKMARVLAQAGRGVKGMFGGESGIYFIEEYERGGRGTMPACYLPAVFSATWRHLEAGDFRGAHAVFETLRARGGAAELEIGE